MRVLVFGDSITQGFWDSNGGWVSRIRRHYDKRQLQDIFNNDEPNIFNLGISGDVTQGVINRMEAEYQARSWRWPDEQFSFVFAIGINDSVLDDGAERSSVDKYGQELKELIEKAKSISSRILFIGLTPCVEEIANKRPGQNKTLSNKRIREFDNKLQQVCEEEEVKYLPIFDSIQKQLEAGNPLFDDGLHPNDAGHQLIFELIQPELDRLIQ